VWFAALGLVMLIGAGIFLIVSVGTHDGTYGSMRIPSTKVVHLPAGRVNLTFTMDLENQTVDIPVLRIGIAPAGGGQRLAVSHGIGTPTSINGVTHDRMAWLDVPTEGDYRVSVDGADPSEPNPQLLFGPQSHDAETGLPILGAGVLILVIGIIGAVRAGRGPRQRLPVGR
jgi:hypothetical protein